MCDREREEACRARERPSSLEMGLFGSDIEQSRSALGTWTEATFLCVQWNDS